MGDTKETFAGAEEVLKIFEPMRRFTGRIERGTIDLARPRTEIGRLKAELDTSTNDIKVDALIAGVGKLLRTVTAEDIEEAFADVPSRPRRRRCTMICDYLDVVERSAPFVLGIVYGGSNLIGLDFLGKSLEAIAKLRAAARGSGETRIEALRIAAGFVLEAFYKELVSVLYELECVRLSRPIAPGLAFGNLVQNVADSTQAFLPDFVDRNAARIRNAAYHDHWRERTLGSGLLELHETEPSLRSLALPELYVRLRELYRDVHDLVECMLWRMTASLLAVCGRPPLTTALATIFAGKPHDPTLADQVRGVLANAIGPAQARLLAVNWTPRGQPISPATA